MHASMRRALALGVLLLAFGCSGDTGTGIETPPTDVAVSVTPASGSINVGDSLHLDATVTGATDTRVSWSTETPAVASVSATGWVRGVGEGTATIRVRSMADTGESVTAQIVVTSAPGIPLTSGAPLTNLSAAEDDWTLYRIQVPVGSRQLEVRTSNGSGDVDLGLRFGEVPTGNVWDCTSEDDATEEVCLITDPAPGTWYVVLLAWEAYQGVTLVATARDEIAANDLLLLVNTHGLGAGTIDPPSGTAFQPGDRVEVKGDPQLYSEFREWTQGPCAGSTGGCIVTFDDANIVMHPRFELTKWVGSFAVSYQAHLSAAAANNGHGCTWTVDWTDGRIEVRHVPAGDDWKRVTRVTASMQANSDDPTCTDSSSSIDKTVEEAASGLTISSNFNATSSSISGQFVDFGVELNGWPATSLAGLSVTYTGDGRSGSSQTIVVPMQVVR